MELKAYQTATLDTLRRFLEDARVRGAADAYTDITTEPQQARRLRGYAGAYVPLAALPHTPYVCLRLAMMWPRLELLRELLAEDGSIWVSIDDNEAHYLKVVMDEVFGRANFILDVTWQKRDGPPNDRTIASIHEHVLVWGKARSAFGKRTIAEERFNLMLRTEKANAQYRVFPEPGGPEAHQPEAARP